VLSVTPGEGRCGEGLGGEVGSVLVTLLHAARTVAPTMAAVMIRRIFILP
jgi:hypothetical protein